MDTDTAQVTALATAMAMAMVAAASILARLREAVRRAMSLPASPSRKGAAGTASLTMPIAAAAADHRDRRSVSGRDVPATAAATAIPFTERRPTNSGIRNGFTEHGWAWPETGARL